MSETPEKLISLFLFDQASMTAGQVEQLQDWIRLNPANTHAFIEIAMSHRNIHDYFVRSDNVEEAIGLFNGGQNNDSKAGAASQEIWRLLSEEEKNAPSIEFAMTEEKPDVVLAKLPVERGPRKINKFSIATAVVSLAAILLMVVYVHFVPVTIREEVATLEDVMDAQWAESGVAIKKGMRISTNTGPFMLRNGYAKLMFDNNTSVLVEAPAEFVLVAFDQVKLNYGRLYAVVPQEAIGFTVTTPNSKIIDLGTEFGVQVDFGDSTQLHVIKGKTTLLAEQGGGKQSLEVNEGQAKKVSNRSSQAMDIGCDTELFVRDIQSERNLAWRGGPLELADMIGGGNGLGTGRANTGISWEDGSFVSTTEYYLGQRQQGTTDFIEVKDSPFVEGVFVPNSLSGPIQISDDEALLWNIPTVTPGQYCYNIRNSGTISRGTGRIPLHTQVLNGKLCGTPENPVISMHANSAVTFDLKEIRQYYRELSLISFTGVCGFSETFFEYAAKVDPDLIPQASFYVLVDGQERFRKDMEPKDGACPIELELLPEDEHLTLVVTGGADQKISYDWCLFACPRLNME